MAEKDTPAHPWLMEGRHFSLIIALAFIIVSISTFFICYRHHVANTEQALHEDRSSANLLSLLLDEHLKKVISIMESYGNRPLLLRAVKGKNAQKALVHLISLTRNPDIDSVIITDRQGTLWAAYPERPEVLGKNFAYRDWYKGISNEWKPYISDAYLRVVAEKDLAVAVGVPLFNEKEEVIGILQNVYRTVSVSNMIKQLPLDPGASISVADRKGQLIYSTRYDIEKEIRFYPFHADMKKAMAAKTNTFAVDDHEFGGRTRYISFALVGNIGWTVFMERDKRSILLSEITYYIQVITISVLLLLSIIIFLFYSRKQVTAQQLTEQLQAEKKMRASQERFKSYIDLTMQLAWTTNDMGEIVEDNPSWHKYTGRGYEEFKGFGWIEDIHPDDRDRTEKIWKKAVAEKSFYEIEYRVRRYDGVYRDYLARGIPLLDENGSIREWVGTCIDITERKLAEDALRLSEERFAKVFQSSPDAFLLTSFPDGRITEVNAGTILLSGYSMEEILGRTTTELGLWADPAARDAYMVEILREGRAANFETSFRIKSGAIITGLISGGIIQLRDGKCFLSVIRDITDRKQAEEAIKQSEAKFRNLFDSALEGVYQSTPEGRLISANMAFAKMVGYASPEEMINAITDLASQLYASPDDREIAVNIFKKTGEIKDFECRMHRKDGSIFWARYDGRFTKTQDGSPCFQGFIVDITDRKEAEEEIRRLNVELEQRVIERTAQLAAANKELEAFSYSVSHDLRAPLRGIDGFSNILLKEYKDKLDAEGVRLLNVIRTSTKQMDQLITDLLALSRVSKIEMKLSRIDMTTLAHFIYHEIASPEVQQKFSFSVAPLPDSHGDPVLLRLVWSNLLANAVKFTLPRDERRIEISGYTEKDMNIYSIRDTGVGFNPNYTHKLFGIFQRLHKSSEFEGNGVGLAIVQRIVHRHGGRVWAEGKINEGAAFFFSLPIKEAKDEPRE